MKYIKSFPPELYFWLMALVLLGMSNEHEHHFTLCPLASLGFESWCPGCGIGRSIAYVLHGELSNSFKAHWFGIPALLILLHRIYTLINKNKHKILTTNR